MHAHIRGRACKVVPFSKRYSSKQVQQTLKECFPRYLRENTAFDFCVPENGLLMPVTGLPGLKVDGSAINWVYGRKPIYIKLIDLDAFSDDNEEEFNDNCETSEPNESEENENNQDSENELQNEDGENRIEDDVSSANRNPMSDEIRRNEMEDRSLSSPEVLFERSHEYISDSSDDENFQRDLQIARLNSLRQTGRAEASSNSSSSINEISNTATEHRASLDCSVILERFPTEADNTVGTSSTSSLNQQLNERKSRISALLAPIRENIRKSHGKNRINTTRLKVCDKLKYCLQNPNFSIWKMFEIKFMKEHGKDCGGPTTEFFGLVLKEVIESQCFEGPERNKWISKDSELEDNGEYEFSAKAIALSIIVADISPRFMCKPCYQVLIKGEVMAQVSDIIDLEARAEVEKIKDVNDPMEWQREVLNSNYLHVSGLSATYNPQKKEERIQEVINVLAFGRKEKPFELFRKGLEDMGGLWSLISNNHELFEPIFCKTDDGDDITTDIMDSQFKHIYSVDKEERDAQENIYCYWLDYLTSCEMGERQFSIIDVFHFCTGRDSLPIGGFEEPIQLLVGEPGTENHLPSASLCNTYVTLPRSRDRDTFFKKWDQALGHGHYFGNA